MATSNFSACLSRVAARGSIGQKEAMDIIEEVATRADQMRRTGQMDPYVYAAADLAGKLRQRADNALIDSLRNAHIRATIVQPAIAAGKIGDFANTIRSLFHWMPGAKDNRNMQTLAATRFNSWSSVLWSELHQGGLLKQASLPAMWRDIANEIGRIKDPTGTWGRATGSADAKAIAEKALPVFEDIRTMQNAEGARIANAIDYAGNTSHDPYLMRRGGRGIDRIQDQEQAFQAWWKVARENLADKTFDELHADITPRPPESQQGAEERFGRAVWEAELTGVRKAQPGQDGISFGSTFQGSQNLARKISEGRVLFWKSADGWMNYMERYGKPQNFWEQSMQHMGASSKSNALMHFLGTNPQANFQAIITRVAEHYRSDVDGVQKLFADLKGGFTQPDVDAMMMMLDGSANRPVNELWATIGNTTREFYDMEFLGSVGVTHATSTVATVPTAGRFYGMGTLKSLGGLIRSIVPDALKAEDRAIAMRQLGAYGAGASRKAFNAFNHGRNFPGMVAALHDKFMWATGIHYWLDHAQNGFKEMVSNELAANAGKSMGELEPHLQNTMRQYGIGDREWEMLRQTQMLKGGSREYLTPRQALDTDPAAVHSILMQEGKIDATSTPEEIASATAKYQQGMADNLGMFYEDAARTSTVTSGVRERAIMRDTSRPGTPMRELWSMATMFKAWPVAALHQMLGRQVYESIGQNWLGARGADAAKGVFTMIALSTLGGYIRMELGDLVNGRQQRVPKNAGETVKIMMAALAQGGGLGIFGDYLFGEANRFGGSFGGAAGGPLVQDMESLVGIYNRWLQSIGTDQKHDFWSDLAKWGVDHVPMQNLFYAKALADYLLWYHVFEGLHPGWWQRTNERMRKTQDRTLRGYVPGQRGFSGVPFNPFGGTH